MNKSGNKIPGLNEVYISVGNETDNKKTSMQDFNGGKEENIAGKGGREYVCVEGTR